MANRNHVTADLKISAKAQLENSRSFINQLDKIIDKFDFGNKINNQLVNAKNQLKDYNKILEKVQNKSLISDNELKDLVKAGKEISNIVSKTEKLYINLSSSELQKFSKEYINKVKAQEEAIAKIKNEYAIKTGKNFDKELANYDKLSAKVKALEKEKSNLAKNGVEALVTKQIEQTNQKLEEQKNKLIEIRKLQQDSANAYSSTVDIESKKRGYGSYNDIKNVKIQSEDQIRKQLGNAEYKKQSNIISEINKEIKNIEKNKQDSNSLDKAAVELARKYKIENVSTLDSLKQQIKLKKDNLNIYKNNKSELANEKLVTVELEKQNKILNDRNAIESAGKAAELTVIQQGGYTSKASLTASASATNRSITTLEGQLTESGIENITNTATQTIAGRLDKIATEIENGNQDLSTIDETNKKLATQSERDKNNEGFNSVVKAVDEVDDNVNGYTTKDNDRIANDIIRLGVGNSAPYGDEIKQKVDQMVGDSGLKKKEAQEIYLQNDLFKRYNNQLEEEMNALKAGNGDIEVLNTTLKNLAETFDYLDNKMQKDFSNWFEKIDVMPEDTEKQNIEKQEALDLYQRKKDKWNGYSRGVRNYIDNLNNVINKKSPENNKLITHAKEADELANNLSKAAEQSSFLSSTFDDFKNKVGYFLSLNYVFDQMARKVTEAVQVTKEMDKDMTQIGLVLGKTSGQVWKNFNTYSQMAERLNTTTSEVTKSMKLFYQQGLNTAEVNKMVEASAIAAALGESTMAEASETLTSIINSYNLSANEAMMVTDKISQIAIVSAADFGELSTAIEKVASSAASAGLDLDHMMGYLAKMIETTREAPTNIGTALKTIVANFTQFKEDPTGLNEEGTEINKVDKALKSVGISLTNTNGEVRDLSEVLDELGGIWNTLNRNQKSYLATAIAGTRQQSRFYALMNDYERTLELVAEGSNSAGKAQQQFGLYTDSLEAATNRLTNQWEKFFNSITSGNGAIKIATDGLTALMKVINSIGPLGSALGLTSFIVQLRKGINEINNFSNGITKIKEKDGALNFFSNIKQSIDANKADKNLTQKQKVDNIRTLNKQAQNYATNNQLPNLLNNFNDVEKIIKIQDEIDTLNTKISIESDLFTKLKLKGTKAFEDIKLGAVKGKVAITAMGKAIGAAMLQMIAIFAVTKIIEGLIKVVDLATTSSEELKESMTQHQDNATTINGLKKEYEELAKKVNKTAEEQERLKEITEEVTKIDAALGNQLKNNEKAYQSNIKAMEEYSKLQKELAAQDAAKAIKKENGFWSSVGDSSIFGKGYWADLKAIFGDTTEQKTLKNERFNQWRNLANARGIENNLSDNEAEMLNNYIEELISKNQYFDAEQIKAKTGQIDKKISEYIESLKNMTKAQKDEYEALKQYGINDDNSLNDFYNKIEESSLDKSTKNQMKNNLLNTARDVYYGQLKPNYFINDADKVFNNLMDNLSQEKLGQLFNRDLSSLDENEKINYQKDMAELFSNENIDTFISKFKIGGEAFDNYINSLKDSGKITDSTAEVLVGLKESANIASKALSSLEKFENIINSTLREGKLSQVDILKKIISDEVKMGDIQIHKTGISQNTTGGTGLGYQTSFMTIDTKSIVASAMQEIENSLAPIKDRQVSLEGKYKQYQNIPQTGIDDARKRQEAAQNKVNDLQNKLKEAQNNLEGKRGDYNVRDASFITRPLIDTVNFFKGKDVVGDYEGAQQGVKNYQKQLKEAQEELKNTTEETKNAEQAAKNLTDETTEVGKAFKEEGEYLKEQADQAKDTYDALEQLAQLQIKPMADFSAVFDQFQVMGQVDQQLNSLQQAWDMATSGAQNYRSVAALIAQDPSLINAIDMESEHLQFSDEALEAHAKNVLQTEMKSVDSKIKGTEAIIACLEGQTGSSDAWKTATNGDIASAMAYNKSWVESEQDSTNSTKTELENSSEQYATWGNSVQEAYRAVEAARVAYIKGLNSESETNYLTSIKNLRGVSLTGSTSELPTVDKTDIEATKNQILGDAAGDDKKTKEIIDKYKTQLSILQKLKKDLQADINNPRGLFKRNSSSSGGGKDKFDEAIEKLEHFYNYLRQLENIEAKLNKIREKRNLIDADKNYYINDLKEENKLLQEQQKIYNAYIADETDYLKTLRDELKSQFGKWVSFTGEGVVQVKQTEFKITSEKEQEKYQNFSELLQEYQNEYNTREENKNKLYEIENTQLENIKTMYDKILSRVTDITDELNRQQDLLDHDMTMQFGSIAQFDIMNEKMANAVKGIKTTMGYLNDFEGQIKGLNTEVKNGPFKELLIWDEALEIWRVNEEKLQSDSIVKKYEKLGYTFSDIEVYVHSIATKSQAIREAWKETEDSANSFAEALKSLIDDRIDLIQEYYSTATDELNKLFDSFDRKINNIDNESNLFGTVTESLEDKYLTLTTATVVLKQTIQQLNDNKASILQRIQDEYPEYIKLVNGVAVINKQAIQEATDLTAEERAELLLLYGVFESANDQVVEMEDKLVDYFNKMLEMEEAKRDAIINLKQQVHDELMARDQQEIDDLQAKYDKMSQLDNEYYSKLSQKINDARQLRSQRQEGQSIAQTQAKLATLKADNSGAYNAQIIELQKQLNQQLQDQADNDIDRELERIQREQKQREEDRQLTISAMENVLTFKDENNWYWQEAQRIWNEGPESVTGFLRSSREYMNISDEQRALEFENLTNSMNTAFSILQTAAGESDRISDGVVSSKSDEQQEKLDNVNNNLSFIQSQIAEEAKELLGKIDWTNAQSFEKLDKLDNTINGVPVTIKDNLDNLYRNEIKPGTEGIKEKIKEYLGANSDIWNKLGLVDTSINKVDFSIANGFTKTIDEISTAKTTIANGIKEATKQYYDWNKKFFTYIDEQYAKTHATKPSTSTSVSTGSKPTTSSSNKNSSSGSGSKGNSSSAKGPSLALGSAVKVKAGRTWYYTTNGAVPSGDTTGYANRTLYIVNSTNGKYPYAIGTQKGKVNSALGWVKKTDIVGYKTGGYVDYTGVANVHGSKTKPEAFLNAKQTQLFEALRDGLTRKVNTQNYSRDNKENSKEEYNIDNVNIEVKELADTDSVGKITKKIKEEIYKDATGRNNMAIRRR